MEYLITGGTGSLAKELLKKLLETADRIVIFSRDELKQSQLKLEYGDPHPIIRYVIGDVRDKSALLSAMDGIDVVIHAAALKQVPTCEYNVKEAIKTNVLGSLNVLEASIESGVKKVLALSTDKACRPVNTYGKTKALLEPIFIQGNAYASKDTICSVLRYGNVIGSRGSVIPLFADQRKTGKLTVTDDRMTRFLITLPQAVQFVMDCLADMKGGEIFVPKIPTASILNIAKAIAPDAEVEFTGIRPGEKLHEDLIDPHEEAIEQDSRYIITPPHVWFERGTHTGVTHSGGYSSGDGDRMTVDEIRGIVDKVFLPGHHGEGQGCGCKGS